MSDHRRDEEAVRRVEVLAAGAALRAAARLGAGVTAPVLDRLLLVLARSHPRAFATLAEMPEARVLIDPVDQPLAFLLTVGPTVRLRPVIRDGAEHEAAEHEATIRGPLPALMDLLEGRIDGDALFFRRTLSIGGDTAVVVALRNALDGEEIDLVADLAALGGPLRHAVPRLRREAAR
ncbi:MAG TPA: SCP2 sterol-binding domain-containing protein, partial [Azospirillum sp.]